MDLKEIGRILKYFKNIEVAAIKLSSEIKIGDKIKIKGATTNFEQNVETIQIHNKPVNSAKTGEEVGIKVQGKVRVNDKVYRI